MLKPKSAHQLLSRLDRVCNAHRRRDSLVTLCNEMYALVKERSSGYLGSNANQWRADAPDEYWESSGQPHNVVDIMTAVLTGNTPQFIGEVPGDLTASLASRAERFLSAVMRINSRRQQTNVWTKIVFKTVLEGSTGVRVYWQGGEPKGSYVVPHPDTPEEEEEGMMAAPVEEVAVDMFDTYEFPITVEQVNISNLFVLGKGRGGQPFDEIAYVDSMVPHSVLTDWYDEDGAQTDWIEERYKDDDLYDVKRRYVEWWGKDKDGTVWQSVIFDDRYIMPPRKTAYPCIPYVITAFKVFNENKPDLHRLPFIYPILWNVDREEYLNTILFRTLDMVQNLVPIHRGVTPIHIEGTWGQVPTIPPDETIEFPKIPGITPDTYKVMIDLRERQSKGTFSEAMFGNVPGRISGYAMSQIIGADTLRANLPRENLELALATIGEIIFKLLATFSPGKYIGVTMQQKGVSLSAMLSGEEADSVVMDTYIQPKNIADDVKLATIGAQLAALPKPPISHYKILQDYFGVQQPEDEIERLRMEEALQDPISRLLAIRNVLEEQNHPVLPIIDMQLQQAMAQLGLIQGQATGTAGMGAGNPQAAFGNPPNPLPGYGPTEEPVMPDQESMRLGGPMPEEF